MSRTPKEQLISFLSDMYSVEQQALVQMVTAPKIAGDAQLAAAFEQHYAETEQQADLVRERLKALGESPSLIKGAIMKLGGKGFLLFAEVMPETPGRLVTHSYSYEAMEWAGYEMLARFADRAGDAQSIEIARMIGAQERAMMNRLENGFDAAEGVSHSEIEPEKIKDHIVKHLTEVHAFEIQNIKLLSKSERIAGSPTLEAIYAGHRRKLEEHSEAVERRLEALGTSSSKLRDSALVMGGGNWGLFFQAQSDTPAKLAAFIYAVLHLEIGGYQLLERTAARVSDVETTQLCDELITQKQGMSEELYGAFDEAVDATLSELQAKA
jgi:ferritin-like metal-binding protein YciE